MAAALAVQLDLPLPQQPIAGLTISNPGGSKPEEVRGGVIKAQVPGLDATEFWFPCYFLGDPTTPVLPPQPGKVSPKNLLSLTGVIDKLRISFDGASSVSAPFGLLIVEKP